MKKKLKDKTINQKGITLVALVVTIVVLIILATISINIIFGEEGVVERVKQAKQETADAQVEEEQILADTANSIDKYIVGERESDKIEIDGNERVVGTFYGKTLYQKTFTGTTPNTNNATLLDVSELNIDFCTKIEGFINQNDTTNIPIGYTNVSNAQFLSLFYYNVNKTIEFRGSSDYLNFPYYVTIQYTKVTE